MSQRERWTYFSPSALKDDDLLYAGDREYTASDRDHQIRVFGEDFSFHNLSDSLRIWEFNFFVVAVTLLLLLLF